MNQDTITLEWTKLTNISEIEFPTQNKYGIYLWGFNIDNEFMPYYLGIADNIFLRIVQHANSIIGGRYPIYHYESLINFSEFKKSDVNPDKSSGKVFNPVWPKGFKTFLLERRKLQKHIDFMIDNFTFTYSTLDKTVISKRDLKEIEKICINQIGKENLQNNKSGFSNRFKIIHGGEKKIIDRIKTTNC